MIDAREAAERLRRADVPSPEHDARVLMRHAAASSADLDELVQARASRVPLQHLVGSAGFRYLELEVGPGVFVPRPETELLVDAVLSALAGVTRPVVVDLGAGSGAIGLSVACEHPTATVHLVESAAPAFSWLARNGRDRERVHLHHADLDVAPSGLDGTVDVVVSNPPYVPLDERDRVDPEVRDHDPPQALWAGDDGLAVIRRVILRSRTLLRPGGTLVVEHSERHERSVPEALSDAGFVDVVGHVDLTGRPRFCVASLPC